MEIDPPDISERRSIGSGKGFVFLSFLLVLLLSAMSGYSEEYVCTDCHTVSHPSCPDASCTSCHGNPPTLNAAGGPDGLVGSPARQTGSASVGGHAKHATSSGMNYACDICHYQGMPTTPLMGNYQIQMGFNVFGSGGGSYDGYTLTSPYSYEGTNDTAVTAGGTKTCSGIYCHSSGTSVTTGAMPAGISAPWDTAGPLACNSCHGYPPSYAQDQPKSNSHSWHVGFGCNVCHYSTTADGTHVTNPANHANNVYNVSPDPNAALMGNPVTFSYQYHQGGGRCSSLSCHASKYWGGTEYVTSIRPTYTGCYEVMLAASAGGGTPPYRFTWDFGDGQTGQGQSVTHYYGSSGPYTVTLNALDAGNHPANESQAQVTPRQDTNVPPVADYSMSVADYTVTLTDLSYDPDYNTCGRSGPGSVKISWGDGRVTTVGTINFTATPSNQVFTHTYSSASTYTINYWVYDNAGGGARVDPNRQVTVPSKYTVTVNTFPVLSGVNVYLKQNGITKKYKPTDSTGSVVLAGVVAGAYQVQAVKAGFSFDGDSVTAGNQNPVTVIVGPNATVNFAHTP